MKTISRRVIQLTAIAVILFFPFHVFAAVFEGFQLPTSTPQQTSPFGGILSDATAKRAALAQAEELELRNQYMAEQMAKERLAKQSQIKIMLFSQIKHGAYLGCLSCSEYLDDSIHNPESRYSSRNAKISIFNPNSPHGSAQSDLSPCNPHAKHPPIVVDNNGTVYGFLTLNTNLPKGIKEKVITRWLKQTVCIK